MRWIFFFLIAANVALFIWQVFAHPGAGSVQPRSEINAPRSSVDADPLVLLDELDPTAVHERADKIVVEQPALCFMVGAFATSEDAQEFIARLAALDVSAFEHPVDLSAGEGYWVYLEPLSNREEARRRLAELQARGVDSYIIPKGELENGISLGVFTKRDLAEARLNELVKMGLAPKLHDIERSYRELWVMLGEAEEVKLDESVWQSLLQENISLRRRQNLCSDVASAKNFH